MARFVAAAALKQLPASLRLALILPGLVGYEEQLAKLTAQLVVDDPDMLGLWLYGPGELQHGWVYGHHQLWLLQTNVVHTADCLCDSVPLLLLSVV
jgi:hypothetical protein